MDGHYRAHLKCIPVVGIRHIEKRIIDVKLRLWRVQGLWRYRLRRLRLWRVERLWLQRVKGEQIQKRTVCRYQQSTAILAGDLPPAYGGPGCRPPWMDIRSRSLYDLFAIDRDPGCRVRVFTVICNRIIAAR